MPNLNPACPRSNTFSTAFKYTAATLTCILVLHVSAQEETRAAAIEGENKGNFFDRNVDTTQVLVIPFEDRMYRTVVDPEMLGEKGDMNAYREVYRTALENAVIRELREMGMEPNEDLSNAMIQKRIYPGIGYRSEKVKWPEKEKKGIGKFVPKKKKTKAPEQRTGTYMHEGQMLTVKDTSTKMMVPFLIDPALQPWLQDEFGTGRTLFLTQFDIVPAQGIVNAGYGLDTATCIVQVHCSIFQEKEKVKSALIRKRFNPCYTKQHDLIDQTFNDLAFQISEMFVTKED